MGRRSLVRTTLPPLLAILILMLALVTAIGGGAARGFYLQRQREHLEQIVAVAAPRVLAAAVTPAEVEPLCRDLYRETGLRFTVIAADGGVLGDSLEQPEHMDNHRDRPEVAAALAGGTGSSLRFSATRNERYLYVARPFAGAGGSVVIRTAVEVATIDSQLRSVYTRTVLAGLAVAALAGVAAWLRMRALGRVLGQVRAGAEAIAAGDLGGRLAAADTDEFAALSEAMNRMANQLGERIATIERQRGELAAVLASMAEGVIAVDDGETVLGMNAAAAQLLGVDPGRGIGRSIQEVGHHPELTRAVQEVLGGEASLERDVRVGLAGETCLQVRASGLHGADGQRIGALMVLNNVTRLRRLETMRRDFVANVSHELKTPITSIKGFVETILDDPPEDEAALRRFLEIVGRQADRLDSIITDLLALSRLEQDSEGGGLERPETALAPVVERVVRDLAARRPEAAARLRVEGAGALRARLNAALIEQALTNLLENAIKYSPDGTPVTLRCAADGDTLRLEIADEGPGIAAEHLPRLFERFYRVDKARSRQLGGTGLGLAIVKHIAQAHGGRAEVTSEVGRGSTFTLVLPGAVRP